MGLIFGDPISVGPDNVGSDHMTVCMGYDRKIGISSVLALYLH